MMLGGRYPRKNSRRHKKYLQYLLVTDTIQVRTITKLQFFEYLLLLVNYSNGLLL